MKSRYNRNAPVIARPVCGRPSATPCAASCLMRCVSQAVSPTKIKIPAKVRTQYRPLLCRKILTTRCDHKADQRHEQKTAQFGQIAFGHQPDKPHHPEGHARDHKRRDDRRIGVDQKDHREDHAVEGRVEHEQRGGNGGRQLVDGGAQHDHQRQLADHDAEKYERAAAEQVFDKRRIARHRGRDHRRDHQADRHQQIDLRHDQIHVAGQRIEILVRT